MNDKISNFQFDIRVLQMSNHAMTLNCFIWKMHVMHEHITKILNFKINHSE